MTDTALPPHLRAAPNPDDTDTPTVTVPVDNPNLAKPQVVSEKRKPIVADWLTDRRDFTAAAGHSGANLGYTAAYHGVRLPVYAARLTSMAPRGAARLLVATNRWVWDREAAPLRDYAVRTEDAEEYMRLARLRAGRVRLRGLTVLVAAVFGLGFALWLYVMYPEALYAFAAGGVLLLGRAGQQPDAPVVGPAVLKTEIQKLTGSIVLRGLDAIGNAKISAAIKKGGDMNGLRFTSEITRDGPGYRADLDLPYGVTPEDIMENRKPLASGLRRKVGCVWPSPDPTEHEGRLVLWVGDKPMNETTKPAWPLLKSGTVDLFKPVVFGNDQRMRDVAVTLMFASVVVGSIPRMGKTFLLRLLLLIAALDPRAELHAFDFKGTGDFGALEPVCHRYRAGDDDEDVLYVLNSLRELQDELRRRAKVIRPCPVPAARSRRSPPNWPMTKRWGCTRSSLDSMSARCRSSTRSTARKSSPSPPTWANAALRWGSWPCSAHSGRTRSPCPPASPPTPSLRFCLKVMGSPPTTWCWARRCTRPGTGPRCSPDRPRHLLDGRRGRRPAHRRVRVRGCRRSRTGRGPRPQGPRGIRQRHRPRHRQRARRRAGRGHPRRRPGGRRGGRRGVWCERIAARLADLRPDVYIGWKAENVTAALKPWGVKTGQVWGTADDGEGKNRRGIKRADITAAITRRDADRAAA